ncbi:MAG TPA: phosphate ABC transporter ATP-binding protein PstB [Actinomycetota bacterium]|nr:phosphate ABC transporter ATP-binding protein PstB [Actinomycetota bacterium]
MEQVRVHVDVPRSRRAEAPPEPVFELRDVAVSYEGIPAVRGVTLDIPRNRITAIIGPSGCGKSTLIRALNRMNDLIPGARVEGNVLYHGQDLYAAAVDPVAVRRHVGMVFQKPNPFPKSVFENVAFGLRVHGMTDDLGGRVEAALRRAALWDEVRGDLRRNAFELSGGQQQRLCIARAIAVEPDTILMDEPCSALDPIATAQIEDLMRELSEAYSVVIVTHNLQQAARVSDVAAFLTTEVDAAGRRVGVLVEHGHTDAIFTNPSDPRTEDYVTGRFG